MGTKKVYGRNRIKGFDKFLVVKFKVLIILAEDK